MISVTPLGHSYMPISLLSTDIISSIWNHFIIFLSFFFVICAADTLLLIVECHIIPVDQGSETRGPHVACEDVSCGQRCFLGVFK